MIHVPNPNPVDSRFTAVFDALLLWRRDDIRCTGLRLKTQAYLTTAFGLGIDDPDAPFVRPLLWTHSPGRSVDFTSAVAPPVLFHDVRVGPKFTIDMGGGWLVTITEDTEP